MLFKKNKFKVLLYDQELNTLYNADVSSLLTLSQTTNFRFFQTESLQMTISDYMEMAESSPKQLENTG